jgi:hypothetical protein
MAKTICSPMHPVTAFLGNSFEESIRLQITSLENYPPFRGLSGKFRQKLSAVCSVLDIDSDGQTNNRDVIEDNIWFLYQTRNNIVHDRLKVDFTCHWNEVSEKGISTLHYLFANRDIETEVSDYLEKTMLEFHSIKGLNQIMNLDIIESNFKGYESKQANRELKDETQTVDEKNIEMNDFMFSRVLFSAESMAHLSKLT